MHLIQSLLRQPRRVHHKSISTALRHCAVSRALLSASADLKTAISFALFFIIMYCVTFETESTLIFFVSARNYLQLITMHSVYTAVARERKSRILARRYDCLLASPLRTIDSANHRGMFSQIRMPSSSVALSIPDRGTSIVLFLLRL